MQEQLHLSGIPSVGEENRKAMRSSMLRQTAAFGEEVASDTVFLTLRMAIRFVRPVHTLLEIFSHFTNQNIRCEKKFEVGAQVRVEMLLVALK